MIGGHEVPEQVQWHEGMLLAPQHLQQLALRQELLFHYHTSLTTPYYWGVRHLKVDPTALVDGTFRVLELEAVMRDGLVVSHLPEDGHHLTLDVSAHADRMRTRPLTVHLVVPARIRGQATSRGELARYHSTEGRPVVDENTGESELRIPRLRPRLSLLAGDEVPQKYTALPLARIAQTDEGAVRTSYVPPSLQVPVHSPLGELCSSLATRVREKAVLLAERVTSPSAASSSPQLLETRTQIHGLVAALPAFEAAIGSGVVHPFGLYLWLCSLVGQVSILSPGLVPPSLEPYDHDDPRAAFDRAREYVLKVLEEGILEAYTPYPFLEKKEVYYLRFERGWFDRRLVLGARTATGSSEEATAAWVERSLISANTKVPELRQKRILGLSRAPIEGGGELLPARGVQLFELTPDPDFVDPGEWMVVVNLDESRRQARPSELVLYVRNS